MATDQDRAVIAAAEAAIITEAQQAATWIREQITRELKLPVAGIRKRTKRFERELDLYLCEVDARAALVRALTDLVAMLGEIDSEPR